MACIRTTPISVKGLTLGSTAPAVCVPLTGEEREELLLEAQKASESGADIAEWRADCFLKAPENKEKEDQQETQAELLIEILHDLQRILGAMPLLFTIRTEIEGGALSLSPEQYNRLLMTAACAGADLVDVEVFRQEKDEIQHLIAGLKKEGCVTVASTHDFLKTDEDQVLLDRFQSMHETGADILKMAVMPRNEEDARRLLKVTDLVRQNYSEPLITMAMGELGVMTRITGWRYGSCLTFGTTGRQSAPGQLPVRILKEKILEDVEKCRKISNESLTKSTRIDK